MDIYGEIQRKGRKISDDFNGLPSNLDAAVTTKDGTTYFFKGDQYYQARGRSIESGPKPINSHFKNVPNDLDAAFVYTKDDLIYFVKGDKFIRYDTEGHEMTENERMRSGFNFNFYQKLKAAFSSNRGNILFFPWFYFKLYEKGFVQAQNDIYEILQC
ncbi:matrix metalloproteinase-14-like protein [Dinothrombium tinctorium]|uniref:Matrix metalloproteinase-14-like protein n=1 Tax=Dinothrombium tinctorium TaxID=1965070 RepID=A0A3S3PVG0_9ACAR|nr:matrix metalloproteinase-14-like protein [Dinothrombium tinctorium]